MPSRQGKTLHTPPFKEWKLFATPPPYNMAKTSYRIKTTPKLFVAPPPFRRGKTSHAPPPALQPPLPLISDQSLTILHQTTNSASSSPMVTFYTEVGRSLSKQILPICSSLIKREDMEGECKTSYDIQGINMPTTPWTTAVVKYKENN